MIKVNEYCSFKDALEGIFGPGVSMERKSRLAGGDINDAFCVELSNGNRVFIKMNSIRNADFFRTEAIGLGALHDTKKIGVPKILCTGTDENISFLMMEFVERATRVKGYWEIFGHELANMHRCDSSSFVSNGKKYGFLTDNYIGANPQKNAPNDKWIDFFRESRLEPQIQLADSYWDATVRKKFLNLLDHLDQYLIEPEFASLIHGDLWSGNAISGSDGKAWILDPATYVGHYEAELAMTQLFGGFPGSFYNAYSEIIPIDKDYFERRDLYNLYHLLNHLNLFGIGYLGEVKDILRRYSR